MKENCPAVNQTESASLDEDQGFRLNLHIKDSRSHTHAYTRFKWLCKLHELGLIKQLFGSEIVMSFYLHWVSKFILLQCMLEVLDIKVQTFGPHAHH